MSVTRTRRLACTCLLLLAAAAPAADWTLIGWNDLGMHCMDGSDYSVFSVLPPYNTVYAQLIYRGTLATNPAGITVTYHAIADAHGSINTTSRDKINFWQYVAPLYKASPAPDVGLGGFAMPGAANTPQAMHLTNGYFLAEGIPISVFDDALNKNYYPMLRLEARQGTTLLASTDIVVPVSDEMDCRACHGSGAPAAARPAAGWAWNCQLEKDVKLNILRLHDQYNLATPLYTNLLALAGYRAEGLLATSTNGTPILCARCHKSNALPNTGLPGVKDFTHAVHTRHANVVDAAAGTTLDDAANRRACYRCHPGSLTLCLRGAMGRAVAADGSMAIQCQDCHGPLSRVGRPPRQGWYSEPLCQSCHTGTASHNNGQIRYDTVFVTTNSVRSAIDPTFASTSNTPLPGVSLYRFSRGHGRLFCEACHGSPHAEFPTRKPSDNVQSVQRQGHEGVLGECTACHVSAPSTTSGGPHGMHPATVAWARSGHKDPGKTEANCAPCHGTDHRGTVLSRMFATRSVTNNFDGARTTNVMWRGSQIGCYRCHLGPNDNEGTGNRAPVAADRYATTPAGVSVPLTLSATDADGNALTYRIVSQPQAGAAGLSNNVARYFPPATFVGRDTFTYAAWDGSTDSNLATGVVDVVQGPCSLTGSVAAPTAARLGTAVPFWALAESGGCSNRAAFHWTFGDGSPASPLQNACHTFSATGVYHWVATLTAGGAVVTESGDVTIYANADDQDLDCLSDTWERQFFSDLTTAGRATDYDHDRFIDLYEFLAGTNPTNDASRLRIDGVEGGGAGMVLEWPSEPGRLYLVTRATDLVSAAFAPIASNLQAEPPVNVYTDSTAVGTAPLFYRIGVMPACP